MKNIAIYIALLVTGALLFCVLMATYPIVAILLLGILMFWGARWSRKKSSEFRKTSVAREQRNKIDDKPILEQLKSRETWDKVKDGFRHHDPYSHKAKAIRNDVIGTLGKVPFAIVIILTICFFALKLFLSV